MLNNQQVFNISLPDRTPKTGFVALGTSEYGLADFDNLKIATSGDGELLFNKLKESDAGHPYESKETVDQKLKVDSDTLHFKPFEQKEKKPRV